MMGKGVLYVPQERNGYKQQQSISNYRSGGGGQQQQQQQQHISAESPRLCSSLNMNRITGARLQGSFAECLGQHWL